ncbi:hypothetical protein [Sinorhizobium meliloti]|uniref:hypothetical protein n=1 Tax=Rhizobium meliloti TaxID=382 RepID=UPI001F396391|nr:hypothetical protein [Sinorhizobium meliloti]
MSSSRAKLIRPVHSRKPRGISEHELVKMLIVRLDGRQARDALGDHWQGRWPDDENGGGDDSPLPLQPLPEPA